MKTDMPGKGHSLSLINKVFCYFRAGSKGWKCFLGH